MEVLAAQPDYCVDSGAIHALLVKTRASAPSDSFLPGPRLPDSMTPPSFGPSAPQPSQPLVGPAPTPPREPASPASAGDYLDESSDLSSATSERASEGSESAAREKDSERPLSVRRAGPQPQPGPGPGPRRGWDKEEVHVELSAPVLAQRGRGQRRSSQSMESEGGAYAGARDSGSGQVRGVAGWLGGCAIAHTF